MRSLKNRTWTLVTLRWRAHCGIWDSNGRKRLFIQASVTVIDVQEKRAKWKETMQKSNANAGHLVFLDESSVSTNLTRRYGLSIGKTKTENHAPLNTPKTTTILSSSSIRVNRSKATVSYTGGTTGVRFVDYLKTVLIPTQKPGGIVVMDNLRSHHVKDDQKLFKGTKFQVAYLPPYSPELNPIKKVVKDKVYPSQVEGERSICFASFDCSSPRVGLCEELYQLVPFLWVQLILLKIAIKYML